MPRNVAEVRIADERRADISRDIQEFHARVLVIQA
jgi:hypothetical protein